MALQKAHKSSPGIPFKFINSGDTISGYYQGQVEKQILGKPAVEHSYKTKDGILTVLGQASLLQQLKNNNITPGTYVEIVFTGEVQKLKGGRTMKVYDVSFDRDDTDTHHVSSVNEDLSDEDDSDVPEEAPLPRPIAPKVAAPTPSAARVQALLKSRNN